MAALLRLKQAISDVLLVISGEGPASEMIRGLARSYGLLGRQAWTW